MQTTRADPAKNINRKLNYTTSYNEVQSFPVKHTLEVAPLVAASYVEDVVAEWEAVVAVSKAAVTVCVAVVTVCVAVVAVCVVAEFEGSGSMTIVPSEVVVQLTGSNEDKLWSDTGSCFTYGH